MLRIEVQRAEVAAFKARPQKWKRMIGWISGFLSSVRRVTGRGIYASAHEGFRQGPSRPSTSFTNALTTWFDCADC